MWTSKNLSDILALQPYLQFYSLMKYPIPRNVERFFVEKKIKGDSADQLPSRCSFSRSRKSPLMEEYLDEIAKHSKLYQSLPFVETMYLCNSLTFNTLHQDSDIDVFIVAQPWRIWLAKFWAMLLFTFAGIKYSLGKKAKKFCLSFFITSDSQNLYSLSLPNLDIYLCYWVQHLVPLYQADLKKGFQMYAKNKRVKGVLPNYSGQQSIFLGNQVVSGARKFKKVVEWLGSGMFGDLGEFFVKYLQLFIIRLKILRDPERNKDVVLKDTMLKFHQDIREKISLKYRMLIKKNG